jgi:hypothetical protein
MFPEALTPSRPGASWYSGSYKPEERFEEQRQATSDPAVKAKVCRVQRSVTYRLRVEERAADRCTALQFFYSED